MILERGEGREKERERNINVREKYGSVASQTRPDQGPNLQSKHVPWVGINTATLSHTGQGLVLSFFLSFYWTDRPGEGEAET